MEDVCEKRLKVIRAEVVDKGPCFGENWFVFAFVR